MIDNSSGPRYIFVGRKKTFVFPILLLNVVLSMSGCNRQSKTPLDVERQHESAIILVPGFYGSKLVREPDGKKIWISAREALFGNQSLTLPIPGLGLDETIDLQPDGILEEISIIPLLYSMEAYGSLLETLRVYGHDCIDVIPFAYDWRRDLMEAVQNLGNRIRTLHAEGTKDITIVAHSMGGLIVSYYLRYGTQTIESAVETWEGAENIKTVVMAGVPFLGTMVAFRNLTFGLPIGLNTSLLTSQAFASFPASYYVLPASASDVLLSPELKRMNGMIRNNENWIESGWGLILDETGISNETLKQRADYLSFWLHKSEYFSQLIHAPITTESRTRPSLLYLYGKGEPTLATGVWRRHQAKGTESLLFDDSNSTTSSAEIDSSTLYADGDGTVTVPSASPPSAYLKRFQVTMRDYEVEHTKLVNNSDIQEDIITFLQSVRSKEKSCP